MNRFRKNITTLSWLAFVILLSASGCKSSKKAIQASNAAEEKAKLEQEAALRKLEQMEAEAKRKEAEEKARLEAERLAAEQRAAENAAKVAPTSKEVKLNQYFETIASSGSPSTANTKISEALTMFSSPNTPVLIIVSEENGLKDYDRPTTISKYLNYLKDQKKNMNSIAKLKVDDQGKITEVELKKNI